MPDEDILQRVVARTAELEKAENRRVAGRMARCVGGVLLVSSGGLLLGISLPGERRAGALMLLVGLLVVVPVGVGMAMMVWFVGSGKLRVNPAWFADPQAGRAVGRALLRGRAVEDPDLAGLAVTSSSFQLRLRWVGVLWLLIGVLTFVVQVASPRPRWGLYVVLQAIPILAMAAFMEFAYRRARAAHRANAALLTNTTSPNRS